MPGVILLFSEIKNIIRVACIYTATIIGAGFASGQEIVQFFSSYYKGGFYGIITAGALFSILGYIVLDRVYKDRIRNYEEFILPVFGWFFSWVVEIAATLFMFVLFCVMIAGSARVLTEKLGIPQIYAIICMSLLCMFFILSSIKGIVTLSSVVTPVLVTGIIFVGIYIIVSRDTSAFLTLDLFKGFTDNWLFSTLIYVSYNSIMSVMIMCSLLPYLKKSTTGRAGGILGGMILCFIALVLNTAISLSYPSSSGKELPILDILNSMSSFMGNAYAVVLWLAMLLSAVNAGFCFNQRIQNKFHTNKVLITILMCIAAVPLSLLGFSNLIAGIYPVFGYIGLFMVFTILLSNLKISFKTKSIIGTKNKL
jgi:Uncharacterized membrane protein